MRLEFSHKIDDLGRILIPAELRNSLGWVKGDTITLNYTNGLVVLSKKEREQECFCCGNPDTRVRVDRKDICENCMKRSVEMLATAYIIDVPGPLE